MEIIVIIGAHKLSSDLCIVSLQRISALQFISLSPFDLELTSYLSSQLPPNSAMLS